MYRPCLHCSNGKYDKDYCPEICAYGEDRKRLKELEDSSNLRPKGEWISVEDRMPEPYMAVLVWDGQDVGEARWEGDIFEWVSDENVAFATHWMPLPEPPGGGA